MVRFARAQQLETLLRVMENLAGPPGDDFSACAQLFHSRLLQKGEHFVNAGRTSDRVALVVSGVVKREASLLMESAEQRYKTFLAEYPAVDDVVADYHVAAYLGITPEALSRLKRADKQR